MRRASLAEAVGLNVLQSRPCMGTFFLRDFPTNCARPTTLVKHALMYPQTGMLQGGSGVLALHSQLQPLALMVFIHDAFQKALPEHP